MIVRNFEYLLALYREGHFANAAKICNVSQPTLSAGIRQLEEDMDVSIVRHGRRYTGLTPEGMCVLAWAQQMFDDCKGLERELSAIRQGIEGKFRLGVLPGTSAVAPVLSVALAEKIPLLQQSIIVASSPSLFHGVRENELDTALVYLENLIEKKFDTRLLYRERFFLFVTDDTEKSRNVTWEHVLARRLCILNSALPETVHTHMTQSIEQIIHTDSMDVLSAHVATGRCSTVLPQSLAERLVHIPNLRAIAIAGPFSHANVGFVASKNAFDAGSSRAVLELVHTPEVVASLRAVMSVHRRLRPKT